MSGCEFRTSDSMVEPQRPELTTIAGGMSMACLDFPFDGP